MSPSSTAPAVGPWKSIEYVTTAAETVPEAASNATKLKTSNPFISLSLQYFQFN
jgi:hypothetical protein